MKFKNDILIVLACSKNKIWDKCNLPKSEKIPAKNAYLGYVFTHGKLFAECNKLPYVILSAEYGVLDPETEIIHYDKKIDSKLSAQKLRKSSRNRIESIFQQYSKVFMIGGNKFYRMVFELNNDFNGNFDYLRSKNQGDLRKIIKNHELIYEYIQK